MPWLVLPFTEEAEMKCLTNVRCSGQWAHTNEVIDSVVILDSEGALTTTDGHAAINADTRVKICLGNQRLSAKSLPMQIRWALMVHTEEAAILLAGWLAVFQCT